MKAIELAGAFGLDNLRLAERPEPEPGPGELLLAMRVASLNYRDLMMVGGLYNPRQPLPLIPCSDGVGEVIGLGAGVDRFDVGDRVCPIFAQGWIAGEPTYERLRSTLGGPLDGTLVERMVVPAESAVAVPAHLSDEEAATLPCAGVTAWNALVTEGEIAAGQTVVVQGTGGVAIFALQLGVAHGARVIVTSSSDEKLERVNNLGAWKTINYVREPEWGDRVLELTGRRGADLVVEVGGAGTLEQSLRAVRLGGRIAMIGVLSGARTELALTSILMRRVRVQGILVGDRESFEAMNRAIDHHRLRPLVDRVLAAEQAREAFETMASGSHCGKICLSI